MKEQELRLKATVVEGASLTTFGEMFDNTGLERGDHIAVIGRDTNWSWRKFHDLVMRIAARLRQAGVGPNGLFDIYGTTKPIFDYARDGGNTASLNPPGMKV